MHDSSTAKRTFRQALGAAGRIAWETMDAMAGALVQEDQPELAAELLAFLVESRVTAQATREPAQELLRGLRATLSPPLCADATALGRRRKVDDVVAALAGPAGYELELTVYPTIVPA